MADDGYKTVIVSTDPAHSLGDALQMELKGGGLSPVSGVSFRGERCKCTIFLCRGGCVFIGADSFAQMLRLNRRRSWRRCWFLVFRGKRLASRVFVAVRVFSVEDKA